MQAAKWINSGSFGKLDKPPDQRPCKVLEGRQLQIPLECLWPQLEHFLRADVNKDRESAGEELVAEDHPISLVKLKASSVDHGLPAEEGVQWHKTYLGDFAPMSLEDLTRADWLGNFEQGSYVAYFPGVLPSLRIPEKALMLCDPQG